MNVNTPAAFQTAGVFTFPYIYMFAFLDNLKRGWYNVGNGVRGWKAAFVEPVWENPERKVRFK